MENSVNRDLKMKVIIVKKFLDYTHSDLWGPSPVVSYGNALYFFNIY